MKYFQRILAVVDPLAKRQVALGRAFDLADRNEAKLKLVDVVDINRGWLGLMSRSHAELLEQERRSRLQALAAEHNESRVEVETEILQGRPALEIVNEVVRGGFDLVIKDARGTPSHKTLLVGSVDMRLLRNCPVPVWLTMPDRPHQHERILAAIDPLANDAVHKSLNRKILELAGTLAEQDGGELHVVAAWSTPGEELLAGRMPEDRLLEYIEKTQRLARQSLDHLLRHARAHVEPENLHFHNGEPSSVLLQTVGEIEADIVVLGTVARNIKSLLMGNTADTVLRQVTCSVLTVKPEGFVSPMAKPKTATVAAG